MKDEILDIINSSAVKFLSPLTVSETDKVIVSEAKKIIGAEYGSIFLKQDKKLKRVYEEASFLKGVEPRRSGTTYQTFKLRIPRVLHIDEVDGINPVFKENGIVSMVQIPLIYKTKAAGVLVLHSKKKLHFRKKDLSLLSIFASLASMAIMKTQLFAQTKSALETRDLFISLASHELRTPLTSINGYIQLLQNRMKGQDTVEAKWVTELVEESARLTELVGELLEINKIKQGQLQYDFRECLVEEFLDSSIKRYGFVNPKRKIVLKAKPAVKKIKMIGDRSKLIQMVTALLSNADKFSPTNYPVNVEVESDKRSIYITVSDKGYGIKRADIAKIFNGFYKGTQPQAEGLGVGLLLTKHIVQYHHGNIAIKSEKGEGTVVKVDLPILPL